MEGWLTLRYRLILVVVFVLIAGFTTTNLINYYISRDAIRNSIVENELPLSSNNIFSEIQADLLRPVFVSSLMASDTFLRDWVINGEKTPDAMTRYLKEIREKYGAFTSFFISNKTLNYYHFSGLSRQIDPARGSDQWFWSVKRMTEPYQINLDYNQEQDSALTVFINYRVLDYDGNFIGVAGIGLGLDSVKELINQYQQNFRRTIYFVNQAGEVQLHSQQQEILRGSSILESPGISSIAHQILGQTNGTHTYERNDELILLTSRYLPELKWYLLVELKESEATASIRRSLQMNLVIGALVVLIIAAIISMTINGFHSRLEQMATTDKLSGLGNRQYFDLIMGQALHQFRRNATPFSLIVIDIDHFKHVNDRYGHHTGDQILQQLSDIISDEVRATDSLCRWGGEEFAILASDCEQADAHGLAEKIRNKIQSSTLLQSHPELQMTLSAGVAQMRSGDNAETLFSRADKALYRAKACGRNRVEQG